MIKDAENKAVKPVEIKTDKYLVFVGDEQVSVEATSLEEAQEKAKKLKNK